MNVCVLLMMLFIFANTMESGTLLEIQFAVPYVFKTLFSREPIKFKDLCETKSVAKGELYLDMNESLPDVSAQEKELDKATQKYKKGTTL